MSWIFETYPSFSLVFLRLGLAVAFFAQSTQQIFGWYGGRGFKGMLANWKEKYAIPTPIGMVGMLTEFLGSFALLVGFLTRPFALGAGHFYGGGDLEGSLGIWFLFGASPRRGQRHRILFGAFYHGCGSARRRGGALSIDGLLGH